MTPKTIGFDEKAFEKQISKLSKVYDSTIRDAKKRSQNQSSTNQNSKPNSSKSISGLTDEEWNLYYGDI